MEPAKSNQVTQDQLDLIERFLTAYNAIDHELRERLGVVDTYRSFSQLVREFAERYPRWREQEALLTMSDLRNVLVHQREQSYEYLSVPVRHVVEDIERIRDRLTRPERVYPKFRRAVLSFQADEMLADVLNSIVEQGFSQFPIYQKGRYAGLLTENGITRWLANRSVAGAASLEPAEVPIQEVLNNEEQRQNDQFVGRETTLLDAENQFVSNPMLEALLITENGNPQEKLLGIVTRWDALRV